MMVRTSLRLAVLGAAVLLARGAECRAQSYAPAPYCPQVLAPAQTHIPRGIGPRSWWAPGSGGLINNGQGPSFAPGGMGPGFVPGLPRGRRYYGGRYFGDFHDRYYSPQYGYF